MELLTHCALSLKVCVLHQKNLPIFAGIQRVELTRCEASLFLENRCIPEPNHLLFIKLVRPLNVWNEKLKVRCTFVPAGQKLLNTISTFDVEKLTRKVAWHHELNSPQDNFDGAILAKRVFYSSS